MSWLRFLPGGATADARRRAGLTRQLVSRRCPECGAQAGLGCPSAYPHGDLIRLEGWPAPLFAHASRIAALTTGRGRLHRLVLAQFGDGIVSGELTRETRRSS